ncbi:hypothetical protein IWX81_002947 [Salinibacterium sp. CAN_S4]|uniref:hypothetical protein n=1 Tax=Salinibacterium sp. CAN_S4 TaxID=2787727 RepID=UPI0018EFCB1C
MTAVRRWQVGLISGGAALLAVSAVLLSTEVAPDNYLGIGVWMLGALVIHDGIAAVAVFAASVLLRRAQPRIPLAVILVVQGALVVAAIVTAIVLPAIVKKSIGTANASILPLDYLANLGLFYAGLAVVTALAVGLCLLLRRRLGRALDRDVAELGVGAHGD